MKDRYKEKLDKYGQKLKLNREDIRIMIGLYHRISFMLPDKGNILVAAILQIFAKDITKVSKLTGVGHSTIRKYQILIMNQVTVGLK